MNRKAATIFCKKYRKKKFYQPVVFVPGIIEIQGKWDKATKQFAEDILSGCSGKSILSLGCMYGYFLHEAMRRGAAIAVGIEHDVVEIKIANEINDIFNDGVKIIHADLEKYKPEQNFDVILMLNVLHILKNPIKTVLHYFNNCKQLIIEHDPKQDLPFYDSNSYKSPRSAEQRNVSIFKKNAYNSKK